MASFDWPTAAYIIVLLLALVGGIWNEVRSRKSDDEIEEVPVTDITTTTDPYPAKDRTMLSWTHVWIFVVILGLIVFWAVRPEQGLWVTIFAVASGMAVLIAYRAEVKSVETWAHTEFALDDAEYRELRALTDAIVHTKVGSREEKQALRALRRYVSELRRLEKEDRERWGLPDPEAEDPDSAATMP